MLTLKSLRDDPQAVIDRLRVKNFDAKAIVEKVLELDEKRRSLQQQSDALLAEQKKKAAEIGGLMKQGLKDAAEAAKAEDLACERYVLEKGKLQVEVLCNRDLLPPAGAVLIAAWPNIRDATGLPVRVWAITE